MFRDILLIIIGFIGIAMIIAGLLNQQENKNNCGNKKIKEYNTIVSIGGVVTVVLILLIFIELKSGKVLTKFAFG